MLKRDSDFAFGQSGRPPSLMSLNTGALSNGSDASQAKKKRKSRWQTEDDEKINIPGMPTILPANLNKEQEEQYLLQLQIEEISRRLRTGDLGIPPNPEDRSPSPEPIYNNEGKRLNTREYRTRKKLEEERHELIKRLSKLNDQYKPPVDYKPPMIKVTDKVMIPQEEHPDINFVGLLIGPRGNTLKNLEKDTGAKIIIRGKGSVKEGKIGRKDGQPMPGEDEPLHAYITATNPECVSKAAAKIKEIIKQGIEVPEQQNDLRRQQLRELALLNGTLRENDGLAKLKQLQQAQTIITNQIFCSKCGGTGHIAQDCKQPRPSETLRTPTAPMMRPADKAKMDSEYSALMAELGEGPPPSQRNDRNDQGRDAGMAFGGGSRSRFSSLENSGGQMNRPPPSMGFNQPPPGRAQLALPPPMSQSPSSSGAPPPLMSQPPPLMGLSAPHQVNSGPGPMTSQSGGPPHMPWNVSSSSQGPPPFQQPPHSQNAPMGMRSPVSSVASTAVSSQSMPWQLPPRPYGMGPPVPPCPPWQQPHGPPMGPPMGPAHMGPPPWHQQGMGPPPGMMPPPPPPTSQTYGGHAPPPPPPGDGGNFGIPLGVPPPPPPS